MTLASITSGVLVIGGASVTACAPGDEVETEEGTDDLFGVELGPEVSLPADYEAMAASDKRDLLRSKIGDSIYETLPAQSPRSMAELATDLTRFVSTRFLSQTFEAKGDLMASRRKKVLHRFGATALVTFEPTSPPVGTGLLGASSMGIVRISTTVAQTDDNFVPSVSLKLFVDGHPSVDIVAAKDVDGQGASHNPFQETFSTSIPGPVGTAQKIIRSLFERAAGEGNAGHVGPGLLTSTTTEGGRVDAPLAVDDVLFEPTDEAKALIPASSRRDFRADLADEVPAGTRLYRVSITRPASSQRVFVGYLKTESRFAASYVGDRLFFRHDVTPKR